MAEEQTTELAPEPLDPTDGVIIRAAMYQMLATGYAYPDPQQRAQLLELARDLAPCLALIDPDWPSRLGLLAQNLAETAPPEQEAEFNRLFSGAMACSPYESAYEKDIFRKQHALADIAGFYRAFGFTIPEGSRWQPDHIGVQLEYCAIVLQRTAQALGGAHAPQAELCVDALRKFLQDHLGRWTDAIADDLARQSASPFYRCLAGLTREWVGLEVASLDLAPDRYGARTVTADDLSLPVCGGCTLCGPAGPVPGAACPPGKSGPESP
jgi:putative dimethyl sulfoxide reductase chaperone